MLSSKKTSLRRTSRVAIGRLTPIRIFILMLPCVVLSLSDCVGDALACTGMGPSQSTMEDVTSLVQVQASAMQRKSPTGENVVDMMPSTSSLDPCQVQVANAEACRDEAREDLKSCKAYYFEDKGVKYRCRNSHRGSCTSRGKWGRKKRCEAVASTQPSTRVVASIGPPTDAKSMIPWEAGVSFPDFMLRTAKSLSEFLSKTWRQYQVVPSSYVDFDRSLSRGLLMTRDQYVTERDSAAIDMAQLTSPQMQQLKTTPLTSCSVLIYVCPNEALDGPGMLVLAHVTVDEAKDAGKVAAYNSEGLDCEAPCRAACHVVVVRGLRFYETAADLEVDKMHRQDLFDKGVPRENVIFLTGSMGAAMFVRTAENAMVTMRAL